MSPTIEITQEQAAALARGENVTLTPAKRETVMLVTTRGSVILVRLLNGEPAQRRNLAYLARPVGSQNSIWRDVGASSRILRKWLRGEGALVLPLDEPEWTRED